MCCGHKCQQDDEYYAQGYGKIQSRSHSAFAKKTEWIYCPLKCNAFLIPIPLETDWEIRTNLEWEHFNGLEHGKR